MRPCSIFAAVGLPLALSWVFPQRLEDGVYTVTLPDPTRKDGDGPKEPVIVQRRGFGDNRLRQRGRPLAITPWGAAKHHSWGDHGGDPEDDDDDDDEEKAPLQLLDPEKHRDYVPVPVTTTICSYISPRSEPHDYMVARSSLGRYCDRYLVAGHSILISISHNGQTGAYVCNESPHAQLCSGREFDWVARHVLDPECGPLRHGQARAADWKKWYGRGYAGMDLCPGGRHLLEEHVWKPQPSDEQLRDMEDAVKNAVKDAVKDVVKEETDKWTG